MQYCNIIIIIRNQPVTFRLVVQCLNQLCYCMPCSTVLLHIVSFSPCTVGETQQLSTSLHCYSNMTSSHFILFAINISLSLSLPTHTYTRTHHTHTYTHHTNTHTTPHTHHTTHHTQTPHIHTPHTHTHHTTHIHTPHISTHTHTHTYTTHTHTTHHTHTRLRKTGRYLELLTAASLLCNKLSRSS